VREGVGDAVAERLVVTGPGGCGLDAAGDGAVVREAGDGRNPPACGEPPHAAVRARTSRAAVCFTALSLDKGD
jgi:hypothetical protein